MAKWDFKDETEMWRLLVSHDSEDMVETRQQAEKVFYGVAGGCCLEIGAGVGRLLQCAAPRFVSAIGVDSCRAIVQKSQEYLDGKFRCRVVLNDGLTLPFADNSFDFVYSFTCFQHMPTLEIVQANLKEAFRALRKDGLCRIQTVKGTPDPGRYDGVVFPSEGAFYQEWLAVGFSDGKYESHGEWIWVIARKP